MWQPIETAPEDGTTLLGYNPDIGYYTFHYCGKLNDFAYEWDCSLAKPDCWMLIPNINERINHEKPI